MVKYDSQEELAKMASLKVDQLFDMTGKVCFVSKFLLTKNQTPQTSLISY